MTHQYQTLVREVTTPTLPTFLTTCLNLVAPKSAAKRVDVPPSLSEAVFCAFATLLPLYPTLYRPEATRIRHATRLYLAPTLSDGFVPSSLQKSARRLVVLLNLTAVKNAGGEEWGKAVRDTIQLIHVTADKVFRAVIEDWESTSGYVVEAVDVNRELAGGSKAADGLPPWTGIHAGVDRIIGLLAMLEEYIKDEILVPVSVPLGVIMDMTTRMLSIALPSSSDPSGGLRPHPAVDRDERDGLWSGMPHIHIATLQLIETLADRLQEGFVPLAAGALEQLTWIFHSGRSDLTFHCKAYHLARKILLLIGKSLNKRQTSKLVPIIRSCCRDLIPGEPYYTNSGTPSRNIPRESRVPNLNGNMTLEVRTSLSESSDMQNTTAATELLPLFVSHLPQKHLEIPIRSLIERTAIIAHHRDAMLACIMTPFIGKDGRAISSIIPYATREFSSEAIIELLLRPRMPSLPAILDNASLRETTVLEPDDEDMGVYNVPSEEQNDGQQDTRMPEPPVSERDELSTSSKTHGLGNSRSSVSPSWYSGFSFGAVDPLPPGLPRTSSPSLSVSRQIDTAVGQHTLGPTQPPKRMDHDDIRMGEESPESSDESVHLTMELDTDSEDGVDG
jgi:pre-rRNA-processing protein RIX1